MEEWKEYKLGEVVISVKDRITTSVLNASSYISTENMLPNKAGVTLSSGVPSGNAIKFVADDILISNIRPYFKKIWQADRIGGCSSDVICLRATNITEPIYLYYLLSQDRFFDYVMQGTKGTKMPRGDRSQIMQWPVLLPSKDKQKKIASILKYLDDKIEVNRKINENLEQQAQALFKSWFVDFEPFKNGEFVESELGMIPKGWRVERIEDLSQKMASGGTPKSLNKDYYLGNIKWYSTKELKDCFLFDSEKHISEDALKNSSAKMFPEGTVLMAIYASPTVGRLGILTNPATFNQAAVGIVPKENVGSEFIYLSLLSERTNLNNLASGAAQQNLNVGIVKNYNILVPEQKALDRFNRLARSYFLLLKKNTEESRCLAELRDTLLPKLMSGELKVTNMDLVNEMLEKGIR